MLIRSALVALFCRRTDRSAGLTNGARQQKCCIRVRDRKQKAALIIPGSVIKGPSADVSNAKNWKARQGQRFEDRNSGKHGRANVPKAFGRRFKGRQSGKHGRADVPKAIAKASKVTAQESMTRPTSRGS
mgnify:CR=1 FL=1